MRFEDRKLILASASPRRRELMEKLGVPFEIEVSSAEEVIPPDLPVSRTAEYLSGLKAGDVFQKHSGESVTVIGSDTVVILEGEIFGKPRDREDAYRMLKRLSGRTHIVSTGVTILSGTPGKGGAVTKSFTSEAKVTFYELTEEEIREYLTKGEYADKAGAYGIQGLGALFVEKVEGDYYTVVGFPLAAAARLLKQEIEEDGGQS